MEKRFSKILKGEITSSAFYIIFGFALIMMPVQMLNVICKVIFGLVLIGAGCYHIYIYVTERENTTILDLFTGVIVLVLGGFLFYNPPVVVKLLHLLLGAFVLVDSIWTLQGCLRLKKRGREEWKILLVGSLIFIVLGAVILLNPFEKINTTVIFAGWVLLANGVADFVLMFLLRRGMKAENRLEDNNLENTGAALADDPGVSGTEYAVPEEAAAEKKPEEEALEPWPEAEAPVEEKTSRWKNLTSGGLLKRKRKGAQEEEETPEEGENLEGEETSEGEQIPEGEETLAEELDSPEEPGSGTAVDAQSPTDAACEKPEPDSSAEKAAEQSAV